MGALDYLADIFNVTFMGVRRRRRKKKPILQVVLTCLRCFLDSGYPYEKLLEKLFMTGLLAQCSYLLKTFSKTKGGLIQLNHGRPRPLQCVANAAFLATQYADYLAASNLRGFAQAKMQYILRKNPMNMSYVVGYGDRYPLHVHHRAASIPSTGGSTSGDLGQPTR